MVDPIERQKRFEKYTNEILLLAILDDRGQKGAVETRKRCAWGSVCNDGQIAEESLERKIAYNKATKNFLRLFELDGTCRLERSLAKDDSRRTLRGSTPKK